MKTAILLLAACSFAAPAFADPERCTNNLQRFETETANPTAHALASDANLFIEKAREAQKRGDTQACVAASERALKSVEQSYQQGNGSSGGSGEGSGGAD